MTEITTRTDSPGPVSATRAGLAAAAMILVFAVLLFLPAGRMDWPLGWAYVGIVAVNVLVTWACLNRWNPVLIERRMRFAPGTKSWDKVWLVLFAPVLIAVYLVAGLEARGSDPAPAGAGWLPGLAIFILGSIILTWSMVANPFFEKTVRIQTEHDHHVIDTGPYGYVRHPGYVGFVGWIASAPLLLASTLAFIPALTAVVGIAIRTALEDRTLRAELPGYSQYAARVRFRLIPGVW
jgi:protein-S-isoprenylcysteine O-methyltransferase Ste14